MAEKGLFVFLELCQAGLNRFLDSWSWLFA